MIGKNILTAINYAFIFLSINYFLITTYVTKLDAANYGLISLSLIVFIFNYISIQKILSNKPVKIWFLWCIYTVINYYFHPHDFTYLTNLVLFRSIFIPLVVMTIVVKEFHNKPDRVLWLCFITHVFYMLAGYYFDAGILFRINDEENKLGNAYALISCFTIFYMSLLNRRGKIRISVYLILSIFVLIVLAMSGTRKAFGAAIIFAIFWALSFFNIRKTKTWVFLIAFVIISFWGYNKLLENTFMGQRMEYLKEQQESYLPDGAPQILGVFGDRASHYYYGWYLFLEHPIFGVGLKQANVSEGSIRLYVHSEFMAQLLDGGMIAFILFILFYYWVVSHIIKCQGYSYNERRCLIGGILGILFIFFTAWGWEFSQYFICLGVLIGYCTNKKYNKSILKELN